jgi:hypothetical protein
MDITKVIISSFGEFEVGLKKIMEEVHKDINIIFLN